MQKIVVTGATGHVGRHVVPRILQRYGGLTCFVRPQSDRSVIAFPDVTFAEGDLESRASLEEALYEADALVNLAYLRGYTQNIVRACHATKVRRAVFVSTTSIFTTMNPVAKEEKVSAERAIFESGLDYTILRPTMIYGTPQDRNMGQLIRYLRRWPVVLVPGDGRSLQQPVHVEDVAQAIVDCLAKDITIAKTYNLSGAQPISFNDIIDVACAALGVKRLRVHFPIGIVLGFLRVLGRLGLLRRINQDQFQRLTEDKSFAHDEATKDFGFTPRSFAQGIREELALFQRQRMQTPVRLPQQAAECKSQDWVSARTTRQP